MEVEVAQFAMQCSIGLSACGLDGVLRRVVQQGATGRRNPGSLVGSKLLKINRSLSFSSKPGGMLEELFSNRHYAIPHPLVGGLAITPELLCLFVDHKTVVPGG